MSKEEKRKLKCTHCQGMRHEVDDCFKLHGVPERFTKLKESKPTQPRAHYADVGSPTDCFNNPTEQKEHPSDMSKLIQSKFAKCMRSLLQQHSSASSSKNDANLVHDQPQRSHPFDGHFAFTAMPSTEVKELINDSSSDHTFFVFQVFFHTTYRLDNPIVIYLLDGSSREVAYAGKARISKDLILTNVLYVPGFTHNLIYVSQISIDSIIEA